MVYPCSAFAVANSAKVRTQYIWILYMLNTLGLRSATNFVRDWRGVLDAKHLLTLL